MRVARSVLAGGAAVLCPWSAAQAQDQLNRADPAILSRTLPRPASPQPATEPVVATGPRTEQAETRAAPRIAQAIVVQGADDIARDRFSNGLIPYLGRNLSGSDLRALSRAVADVARQAGYPFASAWIEPQAMADGVLRVRLDAGTLSAVRVIGHPNALADRMLTQALVTGRPVRREQLERAILLVGDIPGITVKESKYLRQDGFGILLVTITEDRLSGYAQVDNRGSKEVGPIRATAIANARGLFQSGDEASLLLANTPINPSEFVFVRGRYTAPVDSRGATVSASASYGLANPGAALAPLDVTGETFDASLFYSRPILRSRERSLWATVEIRGLRSRQSLLGFPLRDDSIATVTGALTGTMRAGSGILRGGVRLTDGLPVPGVSHEGDARISRSDGDARFVVLSYAAEWVVPLSRRVSLALASEAQVASRPLLATMEIGVGGPGFGRGYDYAERTGDNGILGSGEVRLDLGRFAPRLVDRVQLYASVDGGYVGNLRGGAGGGALLSTAAGVRTGRGRLSGMLEIAMPINADRFDTRNSDPRLSFRLSRVF
ncbi:ShlB/FhaC/HecB family hemolysin secretion/activation protein [Sphingomonas sp. PAMC 26621]|uniref:ShlB/FhaC/HecB family hemolysin secretion/activation protein n=1 Tax=Sphingomonas sp. PAMC 26621 TaxID=1112213 RepID=UPI001EE63B5C|nr:ShlB/FhaC/HecB family hemolysin secretion/activation protein [Sphingomonas sp. PAMC 26621]